MKLKDKGIVITGGSSGIGKAVALRCAKDGAKVMVAARTEEDLKKTAEEINAAGGEGHYHVADVANPKQVKSLFKSATDEMKCLDVVFNNAGLGFVKNIYELSDDEIELMIRVNLMGECFVAKYASQIMKEQKYGHIINTSSLAGLISVPQWSVYTATKWGVTGLTDSIRQELKPFGIKVTSLHPGAVRTSFFDKEKANIDMSEMEDAIMPDEVADAVYDAMLTDKRKILVPSLAKNYALLYKFLPGLTEKMVEKLGEDVKYETEGEESSFGYIKPCPPA